MAQSTTFVINTTNDWMLYLGQIEVAFGRDMRILVNKAQLKLSRMHGDKPAANHLVNLVINQNWDRIEQYANS